MRYEEIDRQVKLLKKIRGNQPLIEICRRLQILKNLGNSNEKIESVIREMNLPFGMHMFIMGNFSDLMGLKYN